MGTVPFSASRQAILSGPASRGRGAGRTARRRRPAVEQIVVYTSTDVEQPDAQIAAMLQLARSIGLWSPVPPLRSFARLFGDDLRRAKLASISPLTSGVLRELGFEPAAEAVQYTLSGLAAAIVAKL